MHKNGESIVQLEEKLADVPCPELLAAALGGAWVTGSLVSRTGKAATKVDRMERHAVKDTIEKRIVVNDKDCRWGCGGETS